EIILEKARRVLPRLKTEQVEFGVGYRPFLPDTKPVIDRSPRLNNVLMAFGHGQLGLTLGATTGRRRRTGWLDAVAVRRAVQINSLSGFCLTKLDVLDGLKEVKICVG
ncbi:adenylosuccinate synthetase, partial [Pseudomonas aeruginosa]|nr:adenylosuccinate synthetase [Pseudomonas aeruginosa]